MFRSYLPRWFSGSLILYCAILVLITSGCSTSQPLVDREDPQRVVDSLRSANEDLRDSLQFYDDIYSGQYYRDRLRLTDLVTRLEYDVLLARDGGRTIETLQVDDIFNPASASLTDSGRNRIADLAEKLREDYVDREIRVEGHADDTQPGASLQERYPSNWELSAARAAAIVRELVEAHGIEGDRLGVVSFGDARPIVRNSSAEGRRLNRRIRVAVLP